MIAPGLLLLAVGFAGTAAAQPASTSHAENTQAERVLETFDVGANVYVRALAVERNTNTLWVGTSAGVNEVDLTNGKLRRTFTRQQGLANEYVFAIGIDPAGYKWFGTNAGGASRYRNGAWKTFFPMHGLADYWVYAFANGRDGDLWIGTWAGASRYSAKTGTFKNYVKELVNEWVYGITVDASGRVWFGTEGGVSMFDGTRWQSWTHRDGLGAANAGDLPPSKNTGLGTRSRHDLSVMVEGAASYNPSYVFSIFCARDGTIWAGTWGGGVARFDGKQWKNLTTADGLAGNIVYSIAQDGQGGMWFGTDNGVSRFMNGNWRTIGRQDGLLESHVYALAVAQGGEIWAGTKRGVARIGKK
jgi:ligand-binding sensor domain-containing protein